MASSRKRTLTILATSLAVMSFLVISSAAVVWANGWRYNPATGSFEQTTLIAVDSDRQDVSVSINGEQVASQIPYRARNLLPDHYTVELTKPGFQTWRQSFWLSAGQIGLIENPVLIASQPLMTTANSDLNTSLLPMTDFGLTVTGGELVDHGTLVTRLSQPPLQAHRFNDYYLYQSGAQLRLFLTAGSQDFLVYNATSNDQLPLTLFPSTWQIAVKDGTTVKLINLTIAGTTAP